MLLCLMVILKLRIDEIRLVYYYRDVVKLLLWFEIAQSMSKLLKMCTNKIKSNVSSSFGIVEHVSPNYT